jgi:hypothetical protein
MTPRELRIVEKMITNAVNEAVPIVVKITVNGKIDKLTEMMTEHNEKHEADMLELKPYIKVVTSIGVLYRLLLALGAAGVAWLAIKGFIPPSLIPPVLK